MANVHALETLRFGFPIFPVQHLWEFVGSFKAALLQMLSHRFAREGIEPTTSQVSRWARTVSLPFHGSRIFAIVQEHPNRVSFGRLSRSVLTQVPTDNFTVTSGSWLFKLCLAGLYNCAVQIQMPTTAV